MGSGLTVEKMKNSLRLKPEAVAQIAFLERTGTDHPRHTKFVALRDVKDPQKIVKDNVGFQHIFVSRNEPRHVLHLEKLHLVPRTALELDSPHICPECVTALGFIKAHWISPL
jgi:hypothetical protein